MEVLNQTVIEFTLLGLTNDFNLQVLCFVIFTLVYIVTVLGNIGITVLIKSDRRLHTPMYFFLSNLSCADLFCSSSVTPQMLTTMFSEKKTISFSNCAAQLFFFTVFATSSVCLMAVMAYDRYVAICKPLHYQVIISQKACVCLVCTAYFMSVLNTSIQTYLTLTLSFCGFSIEDHLFCDFPPLIKLACTDTTFNEMMIWAGVSIFAAGPFFIIMTSYCFIIIAILRIPSTSGRVNVFSTCASHFTGVFLFYGTVFVIYFQPVSGSMTPNKVLSLFYTVVIPMLNPMIYSFRNKEVKRSFERKHLQMCRMKSGH